MMPVWMILLPLLLFTGGCGVLASPPPAPAVYELGLTPKSDSQPERAKSAPSAAGLTITAPSWLRSRAMHYRLAYQEEQRRRSYLASRWVAEPAEMMALALERDLAAELSLLAANCRLRLYLDEFIQEFSDRQHSHSLILVRAELRTPDGHSAASRHFTIRQPAPTPDAPGGAIAHGQALRQLSQELKLWLNEPVPATTCSP